MGIFPNDSCYREGMLVFQSLPNTSQLVKVIQDATDSPITHVGILHKNDAGNWVVIESFGNNGEETPVDEFLGRSNNIAWFKIIDGIDAKKFVAKAAELTKTYPKYDSDFKYDNGKLYCSELIALAAQAVGVDMFDVDVRASWLDQTDASVARFLQLPRPDRPDMERWRIIPPNTLFFSNKLVDPQYAANGNSPPEAKNPKHFLYDTLPGDTIVEKLTALQILSGKYASVENETIKGFTHYRFKWSVSGVEYGLILFGQFPEEENLAREILKQLNVPSP